MTELSVSHVSITFPFQPYPCQVDYMEKVVQTLQKSENAILESPTGTGKTVCLLCSTLGWLQSKKAQLQSQRQLICSEDDQGAFQQGLGKDLDNAAGGSKAFLEQPSKIIYASRTHSQLSQAIQELRRTSYNYVKVGVLGSRDQLCIHPQVSKETSNTVKVNLCRAKVAARSCNFYNSLEAKKSSGSFLPNVVDIEDLVTLGQKHRVCPYYMAKETKQEADILFMPYNYLLDPKLRKTHGVELQNNILIFDEAHNLENICEDSASFDLTSYDLATAIEELAEMSAKMEEMVRDEAGMEAVFGESSPDAVDFTLKEVLELKAALHHLEEAIANVEFTPAKKSVTRAGLFIFELFDSVGITFERKGFVMEQLDKIISHLNNEGSSGYHSKGTGLSKIAEILKIVFSQERNENQSLSLHKAQLAKYFKVHIREDESKKRNKKVEISTWDAPSKKKDGGRILSYWCFSSGHTMQELSSRGVKSIIVTSGTLSPLTSFTTEMQIPFPNTLANPHVIQPEQFMVATLGKGPDGTTLNSSYQTRSTAEYQSSLGNAVVNFVKNVPNGLLLFFPSYSVMNLCTEFWQTNGIWNRILQYKDIFVEPKGKDNFQQAMDSFYECINDPSKNGAVFAAVCRGKVSEGLDFADINGRAVIITGLPFPPMMDARITLKMQFLDEMKRKKSECLTGREWYRQQATRAVNQAIGRVIRHKQDYGAILLCDTRFSSAESVSNLPAWVKQHVKKYDNFGHVLRDLSKFFRTAEQVCPMPTFRPRKQQILTTTPATFMPTKSQFRQKDTVTKASHIENHLPSLLQESASSEDFLQTQYKQTSEFTQTRSAHPKRGLLDALDDNEKKEPEDIDTYYSRKSTYSDLDRKSTTATKKAITVKNQSSSVLKPLSYVEKVKAVVSAESYNMFRDAMKTYHGSHDYNKLVQVLAEIFTDEQRHHSLLIEFYRFVQPCHKEEYNKMCLNITGQGCGFVPEHAISKKRLLSNANKTEPNGKRTKIKIVPRTSQVNVNLNAHAGSSLNPSTSTAIPTKTGSGSKPSIANQAVAGSSSSLSLDTFCDKGQQKSLKTNSIEECLSSKTIKSAGNYVQSNIAMKSKSHDQVQRSGNTGKDVLRSAGQSNPEGCSRTGSDKESSVGNMLPPSHGPSMKECSLKERKPVNMGDPQILQKINPRLKSIYNCDKCSTDDIKKPALVPLQAPCEHICCFTCWKSQFETSKVCPVCQKPTLRRQLKKLLFDSS